MDTLDGATGLAEPSIADAVNKDWLIASARSCQLGADLRSINSNSRDFYNSTRSHKKAHDRAPNESSWLLKHYERSKSYSQPSNLKDPTGRSFKSHLYADISLADHSLGNQLNGSFQVKRPSTGSSEHEEGQYLTSELFVGGKFRLFLACYLLLGITLATYSRNALSLAAVGMVANNAFDREQLLIWSQNPANGSIGFENGCPLERDSPKGVWASTNFAPIASGNVLDGMQQFPAESTFGSSIKGRIERGELVDWSPGEQGLIFAAGSLGNLLIAIPLTRMGEIYGPKWVIFAALLGATFQAALMPLVSPCHVSLVILFQIVFNGLTFGADCVAYTLFAHWLTPPEMAFFVACLLICYQFGTIISSFITASILSQGIAWSWCFYTPAILCGLWTLIWIYVGASEPSNSNLVSRNELEYLSTRSKIAHSECCDECSKDGSEHKISWLKLAKDRNIWAIVSVKFTLRWYFSTYLSLMPTFLSSVSHMTIDSIGRMSVFQSVVSLFSCILMGYLTRSVVVKRPFDVSLANFRKIAQSVVNFGLALSLLVFVIFDCNHWVTIVSLTISGICISFYVTAALQVPLDLSPDHCGLITSITNTLALGQVLGAPVSGLVLNYGPKDRNLWRIVWIVAILLNTLSGLLFIFLVDAKPRDYSKYPKAGNHRSGKRREDEAILSG